MRLDLIDAGPIVAYLDAGEPFHAWAKAAFAKFHTFTTCEAVISEACARRAYARLPLTPIVELLKREVITVSWAAGGRWERIASLMGKYADLPMDFADACLVCMAEAQKDCLLVTLDADFDVYRRNGRDIIPTLPRPN